MLNLRSLPGLVALWLLSAPTAHAVFVIDFEELDSFDNFGDFYSGGTNMAGEHGPDLGVTLWGGWTGRSAGNTWLTTDEQFSPLTAIVEDGFSNGFAFRFAAGVPLTVTIDVYAHDGTLLATASQTAAASGIGVDPGTGDWFYTDWVVLGLAFEGVARWVHIYDDQCCAPVMVVDDYTFGQSTLVPLPGALWLLAGALVPGLALCRRVRAG